MHRCILNSPEMQWLKTVLYCYHTRLCGLLGLSGVVLTCGHCQTGAGEGIIWRCLYSHDLYLSWHFSGLVRHLWLHVASLHSYNTPSSVAASA